MIDASPATLAALWDRANALPHARRTLALLALEDGDDGERTAWTLGRCDATLARIYRAMFGDRIAATVRCDACAALLEFETTTRALFGSDDDDRSRASDATTKPVRIEMRGYAIAARSLRLIDTLTMPRSEAAAREHLFACCVVDARLADRVVEPAALPGDVRDAVAEAARASDPSADTLVALVCDACGQRMATPLDMASLLWEALESHVARTFADVHALARAYGWSEGAIFALSDARRRRYLDLAMR